MKIGEEIARGIQGTGCNAPTGDEFGGENVVGGIVAGGAGGGRGEEPFAAAAEEHREIGLHNGLVEVLVANAGAGSAILGVNRPGGRGGVEDIGGRDDPERFAQRAGEVFAHVFGARIVEGIKGVVWEDALLIVVVFIAGRVAGGTGGGIGDDGVERGGLDQTGDRKRVHRERGKGLALADAIQDDTSGSAVGDAHAVADHDDDVFRFRTDRGTQVDDLKIPGGDHGLAVGKLRSAHGESVDAGRKVAEGAERGDEGVGR